MRDRAAENETARLDAGDLIDLAAGPGLHQLVDGAAVSVLLDWEFAHLGDPIEDVGWYAATMYRREHFIEGAWTQADFLARYTARRGAEVEPDRLHFWQVLAMFKLAAIMFTGVHSFLAGETDRAAGPTDGMLRATVAATRRR